MCGFSFALFSYSDTASGAGLERLKSLEYSNENLGRLRSEVETNLKRTSDGEKVAVRFMRYRLTSKDNFFRVMTRTMMDHDTLSSVNSLKSLWDAEKGMEWLIPNVRGIAVYGNPKELAAKYRVAHDKLVRVPGKKRFFFIPGRSFPLEEKTFLNLRAFIPPLKGRVTSAFGRRKDPFTRKNRFHKGVDISCPVGTPVKASASGRVIFAGVKGGYGKLIILEHRNGYRTLYGHLHRFVVKKGDQVTQGQKIALSGNTGRSSGPHLHFEVSRRGQAIKPHFSWR